MSAPDLTGRSALVTGAGRGIGRVVAEALASAGAAVTLTARSADELEAAAAAIEASGGRAIVAPADVGDPAAVAAVAAAAGDVDVLVNGAGVLTAIGPAWEAEPDDWWANVETTLRGAYLCSRAVLPGMIARGRGTIVNLASGVAGRPEPYLSGYRAGKAALVTFSEDLAAATAGTGVAVFAVAPGFVETAMTDKLVDSPEGRRWLPDAGNSNRVDPQLTAELVLELASGRADALSGRFIHALDDLPELLGRAAEIENEDLYALRVRRLSR